MLIGIDARYGFRDERRGIGAYVYNLLIELGKTDGERYVLYVDALADATLVEKFDRKPFTIRHLLSGNLFVWEQVLLPLAARRDGVDVLHCTANMAPLLKVSPAVITILDVIEFRRTLFGDTRLALRHRLSRFYRMGLLPIVARRADLILTVSDYSRQDIIDVLKPVPARVRTVYLGPPDRPSSGDGVCKPGERFILALGAMDNRKNLQVLFEAFQVLRNAVPSNVRLVLTGIENLELFVEEHNLAHHPFSQDIICRGFVSDDELTTLYQQCACFVYPSLYEGFGLPPLEAMAAGAPVIASETTSVGEIVGEAGLLFDPHSPADLAKKISAILADSSLAEELRGKGKDRLNFFSWAKCARQTLAAYREVYTRTVSKSGTAH